MRMSVNALLITLTLVASDPGLSSEYGDAADHLRRAVLATPEVKERIKVLEGKAYNTGEELFGMEKEDWVYFMWAVPLTSGTLSTKPFRNFKTDMFGGVLRPEIEYKFTGDQRVNTMLIYQLEF